MIRKYVILVFLLMIFHKGLTQEVMPDWFLKEMQANVGIWIADNSDYKSEHESFEEYHIVWEWGIKNRSLKGKLYGVHNGIKSPVFWEFRNFWDSKVGQAKLIQIGLDGTYGIGHADITKDNESKLSQIFITPGGLQYKEGHITRKKSDSENQGSSYSIKKNGQWVIQRTYTWIKQTRK